MKHIIALLMIMVFVAFLLSASLAEEKVPNKYIGVRACSMCHKSDAKGNQLKIWTESKHAKSFTTLSSDASAKIAKEKGLKKSASESIECLSCHVVGGDTTLFKKTFDVKDGVQCESCHGAGSAYKPVSIMKDRAKAIEAGMTEYKNDKDIEKQCKSCHNVKSPNYKKFKFKEMWIQIAHPSVK